MPSSRGASDVIVVGGGTNGLACAWRLARGGARVTLLEADEVVGGAARTMEFAPGFRVSPVAHLLPALDPRLAMDMGIAEHGLVLSPPLATIALGAPGDPPLTMGADGRPAGISPEEAAAWALLSDRLSRFAAVLGPLRRMTPPRLGSGNEWLRLARVGLDLRRLGTAEFREFGRMLLLNAADAIEDELSDPRLMGLAAFDATLGAATGPRSPGTLLLWLNRIAGGPLHLPEGGMGAVAAAMARAAEAAGVTIRTGARVARVEVEGDRARGVTLATGEVLRADAVVSALCPRRTLEALVEPCHLDTGTLRQARAIRARGGAAKVHLALSGPPPLPDLRARTVIAPSVDAVEGAFNPSKYGEVPERPALEVVMPTHDQGALGSIGHTVSIIAQWAPHAPRNLDAARAQMLENVLAVLEDHAPGLRALVLHAEILMPADIESRYGLAGGSWHHGDLSVDRMLFLRPFPEAARYQAPLPGLWLASAGSHPGGGVSGSAGLNAAERLLAVGP